MNRTEQIENLTAGRNEDLVKWLSLEDWNTLPSERLMDDIDEAWNDCGGDMDALTLYVRYLRYVAGVDATTADEICDDLLRDPEARRKIATFDFTGHDGVADFVETLENRYDVFWQVIYNAMHRVRLNVRKNS